MAEFLNDLLKAAWLRVLSTLLIGVGAIILFIAPMVHERFFPVVQPGSAAIIAHYQDGGWTVFHMSFRKNYDCRSIADQAEWFFTTEAGEVGVLPWATVSDSHSPSGHVRSPQLKVLLPPEANGFYLRAVYDCGVPWRVRSIIGPFALPLP